MMDVEAEAYLPTTCLGHKHGFEGFWLRVLPGNPTPNTTQGPNVCVQYTRESTNILGTQQVDTPTMSGPEDLTYARLIPLRRNT